MTTITWVLESDVFLETHGPLRQAIRQRGHRLIDWSDDWWAQGIPRDIPDSTVIFHGSLGNAALVSERLSWSPGSYCNTPAFHCSSWYNSARPWLVHSAWHIAPANELVANAREIAEKIGSTSRFFVRPDSPLKPFSGRVVDVDTLSLADLDYGFYYDDESIPVVAAPLRNIGDEWRFIVVRRSVVAGSGYDPSSRSPLPADLDSAASRFAVAVASDIVPPAEVYVLDVCECEGQYRLLELNPFGGADLYASDAPAIVDAISTDILTDSK